MKRAHLAVLYLGTALAVSACQSSGNAPATSEALPPASATTSDVAEVDRRLVEVLERYGEPAGDARRDEALMFLRELTTDSDCPVCDQLMILERMLELAPGDEDAVLSFENAARFAAAEIIRNRLNEDRS